MSEARALKPIGQLQHFAIHTTPNTALIMAPDGPGHGSTLRIETTVAEGDPNRPDMGEIAELICRHLNGVQQR